MPLLPLTPLLLLCLLNTAATGQKLRLGECPDVEPVQGFDVEAFTGLWYENRKFANSYVRGKKCITTRLSTNNDGVLAFDTTGVERFYKPVRVRGYAIQPLGPSVGSFAVGVPVPANVEISNLSVVDVDYDQYAVLYRCANKMGGATHVDWLWVLSRTPHLPHRTVAAILTRVSQLGIKSSGLRPTQQSVCPDNP